MLEKNEIGTRLSFLRLDTETLSDLRKFASLAEDLLPDVLKRFYVHISAHPDIAEFFKSQERIDFAASRQFEHWRMILSGEFGPAYIESVAKVGATHARIGLEPQFYLAGYTFLVNEVLTQAQEQMASKKGLSRDGMKTFQKFQNAFLRAAMLDMDLAIHFFNETRAGEARQKLMDMADHFEQGVGGITSTVSSAAEEMANTARSMRSIADQTQTEFLGVSASINQATNGVTQAARSSEDLGKAVNEIAQQMSQATSLANRSVDSSERAGSTIRTLSKTADQVGEVIALISDIAEQTNLLALNATIESARAGEAGKGFAVVASEVKSLANQTARATEDIRTHIQAMLSVTEQSVEAIDEIQTAIKDINAVSLSINSALEEQTASTREIAQNTSEAANGNQHVAAMIEEVGVSAEGTKSASDEVVLASEELGRQSNELQNQVSSFLDYIRAS